jgi:hypothetical protein
VHTWKQTPGGAALFFLPLPASAPHHLPSLPALPPLLSLPAWLGEVHPNERHARILSPCDMQAAGDLTCCEPWCRRAGALPLLNSATDRAHLNVGTAPGSCF